MTSERARVELIELLQAAHAGELAAAHAYEGHAKSVRDPTERAEIERIRDEELDHRQRVAGHLATLGAGPDPRRERRMNRVGKTIGFLCHIGGWYLPMYGAGRLEAGNIQEYAHAAELAAACGQGAMIPDLRHMSDVEAEHERFFRTKVESHWLRHVVRIWPRPPLSEVVPQADLID